MEEGGTGVGGDGRVKDASEVVIEDGMGLIMETTTTRIMSPMTHRVLSGRNQTRKDVRQATFKLLGMVCKDSDEQNRLVEENNSLKQLIQEKENRLEECRNREGKFAKRIQDLEYIITSTSLHFAPKDTNPFGGSLARKEAALEARVGRLENENARFQSDNRAKDEKIRYLMQEHNRMMIGMKRKIDSLGVEKEAEIKGLKRKFKEEMEVAVSQIEVAARRAVRKVHKAHLGSDADDEKSRPSSDEEGWKTSGAESVQDENAPAETNGPLAAFSPKRPVRTRRPAPSETNLDNTIGQCIDATHRNILWAIKPAMQVPEAPSPKRKMYYR
jgi:hypothetical protein